MTENDFNSLIHQIHDIDLTIIDLLNERFDLCKTIIDNNENINTLFDGNYERDIINELTPKQNYENMVRVIWEAIVQFSRDLKE